MPRQKNPADILAMAQKDRYWGDPKYKRDIDEAGAKRVVTDMGAVDPETGVRKTEWPKTGDNMLDMQMASAYERDGYKVEDKGTKLVFTISEAERQKRMAPKVAQAEARLKPVRPEGTPSHGQVVYSQEETAPISTDELLNL